MGASQHTMQESHIEWQKPSKFQTLQIPKFKELNQTSSMRNGLDLNCACAGRAIMPDHGPGTLAQHGPLTLPELCWSHWLMGWAVLGPGGPTAPTQLAPLVRPMHIRWNCTYARSRNILTDIHQYKHNIAFKKQISLPAIKCKMYRNLTTTL